MLVAVNPNVRKTLLRLLRTVTSPEDKEVLRIFIARLRRG